MSILNETQFVERLQFFNGQRLFAEDLQGIDEFNRQMRWLHNQTLHQPGIGSGFGVYGQKGDRQVTINPGYSLDDLGREIVLTHQQVLPIPPVAGDGNGNSAFYALTVSYPDDSVLPETETREAICAPGRAGAVRRKEEPVFCWILLSGDKGDPKDGKSKTDIKSHRKIFLAQIEVLNCQLNQPPSVVQRCNARPDCGPHIGCGWSGLGLKDPDLRKGEVFIFLEYKPLVIDTSQAKFLTTPQYLACIEGQRLLKLDKLDKLELLLLDRLQIKASSTTTFTIGLSILLPASRRLIDLFAPSQKQKEKEFKQLMTAEIERLWVLNWVGFEP